jgi:hypothetical protein
MELWAGSRRAAGAYPRGRSCLLGRLSADPPWSMTTRSRERMRGWAGDPHAAAVANSWPDLRGRRAAPVVSSARGRPPYVWREGRRAIPALTLEGGA